MRHRAPVHALWTVTVQENLAKGARVWSHVNELVEWLS